MIELKTGSILDLPVERQQKFAEREGLTLEAWQARIRAMHEGMDAHVAKMDENGRPEGWTDEDAKRWQAKVDSSHPDEIYAPFA